MRAFYCSFYILLGSLQLCSTDAFCFGLIAQKTRNHNVLSAKKTTIVEGGGVPPPPSKSSNRQNRVNALLDWAKSAADIQISTSLELKSTLGGLGWFASSSNTDPLKAESVVMTVPTSVALSVEAPGEGPNDRGVLDLVKDKSIWKELPWFAQMSVYFYKLDQVDATNEAGVNMQPWLNSLPRQFDTPIHWGKDTLRNHLQYDYMVQSVDRQEREWKSYHQTLLKSPDLNRLSWQDFLWGCECARSRAFSGGFTGTAFNPSIYAFTLLLVTIYIGLNLGTLEQAANGAGVVFCASILKDFVIPKLNKKKRYVICPMIDMANHQSMDQAGEVSFEYFGNAYSLALSPGKPAVSAGQELYISYGARSNDQLLQYYGFVETNNPHDVYIMPPLREWDIGALEKACGRQFVAGRLEKLDRAGLLGNVNSGDGASDSDGASGSGEDAANAAGGVVLTRALGVDPAVLQALRALVSTDEEWEASGEAIGNFCEELSGGQENERCARLAAKTAIEMELASKPTSIKEDEELLQQMETMKSLDASREEKLAVLFRIEKKKLLLETLEAL